MSSKAPLARRARRRLEDAFAADLHSLAAFRIALALVVLMDLADRARNLTAHYTDAGVLPRAELLANRELLDSSFFSVNLISGGRAVQVVLLALAAIAAIGLLVGYATRLMTLIVWLLVVSIEWRNPLVGGGGEILLRLLLFWGMFVPLGAVWSIDRLRRRAAAPESMRVVSVPITALFLQIAFVYWFAFLLKSGPEWRWDGTALERALSLEQFAKPFATFLLDFPGLLAAMTFGVLALECLGPFLLLSPFRTGLARTLGVALFMGFHAGIWLTLGMGMFPVIAGAAMVCFLPPSFWNRVESLVRGRMRRRRRGPADSATAPGGDPQPLRNRRPVNLFAGGVLALVLFWNVATVSPLRVPSPLQELGTYLGIGQIWDMFAPSPLNDDGWYVVPATLRDGRTADAAGVLRGDVGSRPLSWRKPDDVRGTYGGERWRKYLETVRLHQPGQHRYLGWYICREWNSAHSGGDGIASLVIGFMAQRTEPELRTKPALRVLWGGGCA